MVFPKSSPFKLKGISKFAFSKPSPIQDILLNKSRASKTLPGQEKTKVKGLDAKAKAAIKAFKKKRKGKLKPICEWIEENCYDWTSVPNYQGIWDYSNADRIKLTDYQKDILTFVLTQDKTGLFPYSTVIWSEPKKGGKTQTAANVGAYWGAEVEAPNLIYTLASNKEQSAGLIFNSMVPTLQALGAKTPNTNQSKPVIQIPNGTTIQAIPNNYAGQAGGNYGLTLWSELWTYKSENDRRLYDEMPPVPTRKNSIRWVETYAGFEDESSTLLDIYLRVFKSTKNKELRTHDKKDRLLKDYHKWCQCDYCKPEKGKPIKNAHVPQPVKELKHIKNNDGSYCCYHIPAEGLFMYWSHVPRAPWITKKYISEERASNRHSTFVRLWENKWQSSEGTFLEDPDVYDSCVTLKRPPNLSAIKSKMVLAGDASQRNDTSALVGVNKRQIKAFGQTQQRFKLRYCRIFDPLLQEQSEEMQKLGSKKHDLDLDMTMAKEVKRIYDLGLMAGPFLYDPFQMHQVAINLRKLKVPCLEFNQGALRRKADGFLWDCFDKGEIDVFPHLGLASQTKSANVKEYENEEIRIVKGTASNSKKVDATVSLSMATYGASKYNFNTSKKRRKSTSIDYLS